VNLILVVDINEVPQSRPIETVHFAHPLFSRFGFSVGLVAFCPNSAPTHSGVGADPPGLQALADQHARTTLYGLLLPTAGEADERRTN
jgi:hypothetical protein